jgi:hypothetical protein
MSRKMRYGILTTLICMVAFVSIAAAHEVSIPHRANVGNGPALEPGTYRVEVVKSQDSSEVLFYKGGDLWLRAPVILVEETDKAQRTEIYYEQLNDAKVINQIRLRGLKESLVFNRAPSGKAE